MGLPTSFKHQRVLILAPHPDDESLATGGLIQRAIKDGGQVRVVFTSDGENNPWPQRVLERRWAIGRPERARWGIRRRAEALEALRCLGVPEENVQFLGFPDQGMTSLLLRSEEGPVTALREAIRTWRPTLVVSPSPHDLHPDHNALSVILSIASSQGPAVSAPDHIHYLVHRRADYYPRPCWTLHLSAEEQRIKLHSIQRHRTQMVLSRKRFLAYARGHELFHAPGAINPSQRIRHAEIENGALCVWIHRARGLENQGELLVAIESESRGSLRWRVPIQDRPGIRRLKDAAHGHSLRNVSVRRSHEVMQLRLPISPALPVQQIALKLRLPTLFYDATGWYQVPLPTVVPFSCSELSVSVTRVSSSSFALSSFGGGLEASA